MDGFQKHLNALPKETRANRDMMPTSADAVLRDCVYHEAIAIELSLCIPNHKTKLASPVPEDTKMLDDAERAAYNLQEQFKLGSFPKTAESIRAGIGMVSIVSVTLLVTALTLIRGRNQKVTTKPLRLPQNELGDSFPSKQA